MVLTDFDKTIYLVENRKNDSIFIRQEKYKDWCIEYGSDETTTPNGVAPRKFIYENEETNEFELRTWGLGGRYPSKLISNHETYDEAYLELLSHFEYEAYISDQTNHYYETYEEALEAIAESKHKSIEVIKRYLRINSYKK